MNISSIEIEDIIRLYFVRPMRGKVIKRNVKFIEYLDKIPDIDNFEELLRNLEVMLNHNSWYITIQLPLWFMHKYEIRNEDITRLSKPEKTFAIERRRLNHELDLKIEEIKNYPSNLSITITGTTMEIERKNVDKN